MKKPLHIERDLLDKAPLPQRVGLSFLSWFTGASSFLMPFSLMVAGILLLAQGKLDDVLDALGHPVRTVLFIWLAIELADAGARHVLEKAQKDLPKRSQSSGDQ